MKHLNVNIIQFERNSEKILGKIVKIINENDRIALIGNNGAGKSTFMKILSGQITDYVGSIENIGNMTLGYLEQIHFSDVSKTVREELRDAFKEIRIIEKSLTEAEENMKKEEEFDYENYTDLLERYSLLGGYTYNNEVERVAR